MLSVGVGQGLWGRSGGAQISPTPERGFESWMARMPGLPTQSSASAGAGPSPELRALGAPMSAACHLKVPPAFRVQLREP